MIRKIAGVVFGAIIAIALITVVQMIGHAIYPAPPGIDFGDPASVATMMFKVPAGALLFVILSYVIGAFGGGMLAALVARETPMLYAAIVGGLVFVGTVLNLFAIPHPTWFAVSAIVGIVATVLVTGRLAPLLIAERHK